MKITELQVRNFTVFEQVDFRFAPGINVFIGENGTGKTHLLKLLYALLRGVPRQAVDESEAARQQQVELAAVFLPDEDDVGRLVRTARVDEGAVLWLKTDLGETRCRIDGSGLLTIAEQTFRGTPDALFLPAREVLAMYENFVSVYEERKLSFDKTYRDLCLALQQTELRGEAEERASELARPLREALGGRVLLRGTRFYVDFGDGHREAHLVAEGLRKVATLARLVANGGIRPGSVLFWDEPEANLNPKLVRQLAGAMHRLAAQGVQIFVATHDFLLSQELSLIAKYRQEPRIAMSFFALHHASPLQPIAVETADSLAELHHNAILVEYASHYDREQALFAHEARGEEDARR
ncbi:ATP-binding protein [Sorangium cellulosum]|uniref:ATP-binding protein n=1 Tax=Sorangium cellulosum TaxID=56 RepID=A0A4P2PW89_SORCE|nr:AAA family ATPase [Sorangium cellulosum]AUX20940.1 ATP-binding protein [Sorangium cellulosum]